MSNNFLFGISLTASFLAGALALFAPCCITFLFPSYLGTIFKEGKKVMFYTLVFALGLSSILIPVALGFRFFIEFFDSYHKSIYYLGGVVLIIMGILTVKPFLRLPQLFHTTPMVGKKINITSAFGLGVMSGLTSSCCAPVLFAAVTLTSLSPTMLQALFVSIAYILGIVFPLFFLSLFYKRITQTVTGKVRHKVYTVFQILGATIFILSGITIIILTYLNKIQMYQMEGYSKGIRLFIFGIAKQFQNPILDLAVFMLILFGGYKVIKKFS